MSRARHTPPPPDALLASALSVFVREHRQTQEDWMISDMHSPGNGSRDCWICHEVWPCQLYREMATRLGWDGGWPWLRA